jgi:hypothetical protein
MTFPISFDRLCYIHVYKCGGTSMRKFITENIDLSNTKLIDQWIYEWERSINPPDRTFGNMTRAEYLRFQYHKWDPLDKIVVLSHSFFYSFMKRWSNFTFATLLRNPIDRVISQFNFQRRTFEHFDEISLKTWLDSISSFEFNMQTAAFCGSPSDDINVSHLQMAQANLHYFDFIGFVEDFEESIELFKHVYGIENKAIIPELNKNPEKVNVPEDLIDQLKHHCRYDIELIEYARRLYIAKKAALEMDNVGDKKIPPPTITLLSKQ